MKFSVLLSLVIGFCVGVTIESVWDFSLVYVVWLLLFSVVAGLLWRQANFVCPAPLLLPLACVLLAAALGMFRTNIFELQFDNSLAPLLDTEVTLVGEVIGDPDIRSSMQILTIAYETEKIRVTTDKTKAVSYGDEIEVTGNLEKPEAFVTALGREFDYVKYLEAKGIEYQISFAEVNVPQSQQGNVFLSVLLHSKHRLISLLDIVLSEPQGSLADGLLLGLDQGLGNKLEEDFRRAGIIHIVVLSGYNIMLVVSFVMFILSFFLRRKSRLVFGLLAILSFALIVGLSATVVRASIMASLLLIAQSLGRSYSVIRSLLLAGIIMVAINPYLLLFDIGFQLSFMATLGLILALPWFTANSQPELLTSVRGYVVATAATQIAVLPLLIYHIGEISLVSVFVNVLVLPSVPIAMFGAFVAAVVYAVVPAIGLLIGFVTQLVLSYIIVTAEFFSSLPFATYAFDEIAVAWVFVMYGVIGFGYWSLIRKTTNSPTSLTGWTIEEETKIETERATTNLPKLFQ